MVFARNLKIVTTKMICKFSMKKNAFSVRLYSLLKNSGFEKKLVFLSRDLVYLKKLSGVQWVVVCSAAPISQLPGIPTVTSWIWDQIKDEFFWFNLHFCLLSVLTKSCFQGHPEKHLETSNSKPWFPTSIWQTTSALWKTTPPKPKNV